MTPSLSAASLDLDTRSSTLSDAPTVTPLSESADGSRGFLSILDGIGATFDRAERSERAFAAHQGALADMVVERAAADVALSIATAAAGRVTQAVSTLVGMQI